MSDLAPQSNIPAMASAGAVAAPPAPPVGPDTLITIKIIEVKNSSVNRRLKLPLRELGARSFPQKIRQFLSVLPSETLVLERYSDSLADYILLDSENPAVYKQLYRAAKAKLKLRIRAMTLTSTPTTLPPAVAPAPEVSQPQEQPDQPYNYLETVLRPAVSNEASQSEPEPTPAMTSPQIAQQASMREEKPRAFPLRFSQNDHPGSMFCIDCNNCGRGISAEHYHCGTCDDGDYDLCPTCIEAGVSCAGQDHWLLKRVVQNGVVINSTTETIAPNRLRSEKPSINEIIQNIEKMAETPKLEKETVMDRTQLVFEEEAKQAKQEEYHAPVALTRTCNACFREFPETNMVSCKDCDDYDLCVTCLLKDSHGHNPAHEFTALDEHETYLKNTVLSRCRPGRHYHHAAICDGCEKRIIGVRHKCLVCPDWDYCWSCVKNASQSHPQHRFVPIYGAINEPSYGQEVHYGIYCDGPLCRSKPAAGYITGVRYKCAICHDTDFCAACEALPTSTHNRTHPLIKFRTAVRSVSVNTLGADGFGGEIFSMGDRSAPAVPVTAPSASNSSTVVEAPSVVEKEETPEVAKEIFKEEVKEKEQPETPVTENSASPKANAELSGDYLAYFMRDTIADGTTMAPSHVFQQTWSLYNPGPLTWPVGTSVRFVGGDSMFNVNTEHPSSTVALAEAMSTNELKRPVAPSESADFSITLKSSQRVGTSISYWRMKLPNGTPFGHKLWCEIKVAEEPKPEAESETPLAGSNMVFPKLEKESPVSSTHEEFGLTTTQSYAAPVSNADEQSISEDVESLTLQDIQSEDEGFLTDEEYDILDASDQESFNGKQN